MAKKRFLVVEDSFINMQLIKADAKQIVEIETDIDAGGMTPGSNLVEVDESGAPIAAGSAKGTKKRTAAAHNDGTGADGLA